MLEWLQQRDWIDLAFSGVGVALVGWLGRLVVRRRRTRESTKPSYALIEGDVSGSMLHDVKTTGADHLIKGDVSETDISKIRFKK